MFTGLIADLGEITNVVHSADGVVLTVSSELTGELSEGDSIAVNGVCLTATAVAEHRFSAEVMNETLRLSSLAEAGAGSPVNLELALRAYPDIAPLPAEDLDSRAIAMIASYAASGTVGAIEEWLSTGDYDDIETIGQIIKAGAPAWWVQATTDAA